MDHLWLFRNFVNKFLFHHFMFVCVRMVGRIVSQLQHNADDDNNVLLYIVILVYSIFGLF